MIYAVRCIRSTVRLVSHKVNGGGYPLPCVWHGLSQSPRMSSTHTHKQLVRKPEHLENQQQDKQTQPKHEQQFALNQNHVSVCVRFFLLLCTIGMK